ncbi:MAG: hypothetical protein ACIAXF_17440, partial [Phycisphaerales bacterium JB063]
QVTRIPLEDLDRVEIQRLSIQTHRFAPIDLTLFDSLEPDEITQQRIGVTPNHRFSEPTRVILNTQAPGARCLLDLDAARSVTGPEEQLDADALAMFYEEHEIDLLLTHNDEGRPLLQRIACSLYLVDAALWDSTPQACVALVKDQKIQVYPSEAVAGGSIILATTCDGTMALFRIVEVAPADAEMPGQVTLEVRRLVEP